MNACGGRIFAQQFGLLLLLSVSKRIPSNKQYTRELLCCAWDRVPLRLRCRTGLPYTPIVGVNILTCHLICGGCLQPRATRRDAIRGAADAERVRAANMCNFFALPSQSVAWVALAQAASFCSAPRRDGDNWVILLPLSRRNVVPLLPLAWRLLFRAGAQAPFLDTRPVLSLVHAACGSDRLICVCKCVCAECKCFNIRCGK